MNDNPAPFPSPPFCWTGLGFLPSSKIYTFIFYFFFPSSYRKQKQKLLIWPFLACVRKRRARKSKMPLAFREFFHTLFEMARAAAGMHYPQKTQRDTGRKHGSERDGSCRGASQGDEAGRGVDLTWSGVDEVSDHPTMTSWSSYWAVKPTPWRRVCARCHAALTADLLQPSSLATSPKVLLLIVPLSQPLPTFFSGLLCFTSLHADSRTCWWCSCSGPALSACRPPPGEGRRSPVPGRRRAPRSGSPSAAERPASAWPPRCSSTAGSSTCRPVAVTGVVCWGVWERRWREERRRNKNKEEENVGWEGSVVWWGRRNLDQDKKVATAEKLQLQITKTRLSECHTDSKILLKCSFSFKFVKTMNVRYQCNKSIWSFAVFSDYKAIKTL